MEDDDIMKDQFGLDNEESRTYERVRWKKKKKKKGRR